MPVMWPRRVDRSAEISPNFSTGTLTSSVTIGSSRTGRGLLESLAEGVGRGGLERLLRAIDRVIPPKKTSTSTSTTGLPEITPFSSCSRTPFSTAGMNWLGITPPLTAFDELNPSPRPRGRTRRWTSANWPRPPVCFLCRWWASAFAGDRLEVGDVRDVGVDVELVPVLEPVLDDVEVQLAHPRDHQLVGLGVAAEGEGRVFVGDLGQADRDLRLVFARLGLDGPRDHRGRELDRRTRELATVGIAAALLTVSEMCRSSNLAIATMSPAIASFTSSCVLPWSP